MIEEYIAGDLTESEREFLQRHLDTCPECAGLLEVHRDLMQMQSALPEPDDTDLLVMRRAVLAQIARQERKETERLSWWSGFLRLHPAAALASAVVLILVGVVAGRMTSAGPELSDDVVMEAMVRQASQQNSLSDYWDSPLSYSNVAVRPLSGDRLELSFDVCRHMNMVTSLDSPMTKDVLLHALLAPSTMGAKMKVMSLTPEIPDPQLRDALVLTMHEDPTLAVRLEALAALTRYPYDDYTRDALLTTLRRDTSVQMRLLALEYLVERKVDADVIQETIQSARLESDTAVLQRAVILTADYQ
jgi:hypothetical protein